MPVCASAWDILHMPGIDQACLRAAPLQNVVEGNPIYTGGFHRHRRDPTSNQPVGQLLHILSKRAEDSNRVRIPVGCHSHEHLACADIDSSGATVQNWPVLLALSFSLFRALLLV